MRPLLVPRYNSPDYVPFFPCYHLGICFAFEAGPNSLGSVIRNLRKSVDLIPLRDGPSGGDCLGIFKSLNRIISFVGN